jgi:hypothetical protein
MIPGIEPLYQRIAESIQGAISEDWSTAKMDAVFYSDSITYLGEYVTPCGVLKDFGTSRDGQRAFRELRQKFADAGKPLWGQACFELNANGKFDLKLGYINCDENGDTIFDELEERQRLEERRKRIVGGGKPKS